MNKCFFTFFILLFGNNLLFSQQLLIPLNRDINITYENKFNQKSIYFHTTSKPYVLSDINFVFNSDSIIYKERNMQYKSKLKQYLWRKLRKENFIVVDSNDFYLTINPLFNFEIGKNIVSDSFSYVNTRGLIIQGNIGNNLSFSSSFYENQARFINYINDFIVVNSVVPGQGPVKSFKTSDFDFSYASAYISTKPINHLNVQLGYGKNFFGEGYRSLLLSDNAFNYPYLKITTLFKKFQYTTMYTSFINNVCRTFVSEFPKKYTTFHFLSYNINTKFNVSLFESTIWQSTKNNQTQTYSFEYLNPIIFLPAAIYKLNDSNNVMLGLNAKFKLFNKFALYAQFVVDNYETSKNKSNNYNKIAYQYGVRGFDIFTIKNLNITVEYNQASPYTYACENPAQSYSHYNQPLAHPLGANFKETIIILNYRLKDFFVEAKLNYALYGDDTLNSNYGKNIFYHENSNINNPITFSNKTLQGLKTTLIIKDIRLVYLVNPIYNFNLLAGISDRQLKSTLLDKNSLFFYFGIRTSLSNFYYDF